MMPVARTFVPFALALALSLHVAVPAQTPVQWELESSPPSAPGHVYAVTDYDDGTGSALYAVGEVQTLSANGLPTRLLHRFDGQTWVGIESPFTGAATSLAVWDDGSGPSLYVGGKFTGSGSQPGSFALLRYDGSQWTGVPGLFDRRIACLAVFDPGSGSRLYAGGDFTSIDGVQRAAIASWDGNAWASLGAGLGPVFSNPNVVGVTTRALLVHDDGSGPALFAGGSFTTAGGQPANHIARWNGAAWSPLGPGLTGSVGDVNCLATFDAGSGPRLYAGGYFLQAGALTVNRIARWDGAAWSSLGSGVTLSANPINTLAVVNALAVYDDGSGPSLVAAGRIGTVNGVSVRNVARWSGSAWSSLGGGVQSTTTEFSDVYNLHVMNGGATLIVAGHIDEFGNPPIHGAAVAARQGGQWSGLGGGLQVVGGQLGISLGSVSRLLTLDRGQGPRVVATGSFFAIGGVPCRGIAEFDGRAWHALGSGLQGLIESVTVHDDGSGPALYASAGGLWRFDGSNWIGLTPPTPTPFQAMALVSYDSGAGPALHAVGVDPALGLGLFRWTGSSWTMLATSPSFIEWSEIRSARVLDAGGGSALYFCGTSFDPFSSNSFGFLARWNGSTIFEFPLLFDSFCDPKGTFCGTNGTVSDVLLHDFGNGNQIVVSGFFDSTSGTHHVSRWTGSAWASVGGGLGIAGGAGRLRHRDDGRGSALEAFVSSPTLELQRARFDGSSWSIESIGLGVEQTAVTDFDDGSGEDLVVCGLFGSGTPAVVQDLAYAHSCLDSRVGAAVGATERILGMGPLGSATTERSATVMIGQPLELTLAQPATTANPADFLLLGLVGSPTPTTVQSSALGFSAIPLPYAGGPSFFLTSSLGGLPQLVPSTPAPWSTTSPGFPFPLEVTVQGIVIDDAAPLGLSLTNGIVLRVLP